MERKVEYGSLGMFRALDARGERHQTDRPGNTAVVHRKGYMDVLVARIEEYDPDGRKAYELAAKYYK